MVNYSSRSLDRSFRALSDPTRRAILARISKGEATTVSELAAPFSMSLAAVSKHLQVLEKAKFIKKSKSGRVITCQATLEPLREMTALLEDLGRYWNQQLDSLEKFLVNEIGQDGERNEHASKRDSTVTSGTTRHPRKKR